ncbi:hypothetical protein BC828DRAFT_257443 [Blastocladiella britannica]|nr:hypothetical protein BC828DRAFT_257443 [Blastocladiella britannica]
MASKTTTLLSGGWNECVRPTPYALSAARDVVNAPADVPAPGRRKLKAGGLPIESGQAHSAVRDALEAKRGDNALMLAERRQVRVAMKAKESRDATAAVAAQEMAIDHAKQSLQTARSNFAHYDLLAKGATEQHAHRCPQIDPSVYRDFISFFLPRTHCAMPGFLIYSWQ